MLLSSFKIRSSVYPLARHAHRARGHCSTSLWGPGRDVDLTSLDSALGHAPDDVNNLPVREALRTMDRILPRLSVSQPPINYNLANINLDDANMMIPLDKTPKGIIFDENWLDETLDHFFKSSRGSTFGDFFPLFYTEKWCRIIYNSTRASRASGSRQRDVDLWMNEATSGLFSLINQFAHWHKPEREGKISTREGSRCQVPILALDNHYAFRESYVSCDQRVSEVRHIKLLPTMVELARNLQSQEEKQGKPKIVETMDFTIPDIFKQAYFSSISEEAVVWIGHPALYTIGYSHNGYLYLSGWRSSNPEQVATWLQDPAISVSLAEFAAETIVLANLEPHSKFQAFLKEIHRPLPLPRSPVAIWAAHLYFKSVRAIQHLFIKEILLGGAPVYGYWTAESESVNQLSPSVLSSFPQFISFRESKVWANPSAVAKVMAFRELEALRELQGIEGIPTLYGSLEVKVTDPSAHKDRLPFYVAIMANVGSSVRDIMAEEEGAVGEFLGEEVYDTAILRILQAMHGRGWHHHKIHGYDNATQDKDGNVYLVDFAISMRPENCVDEDHCRDLKAQKLLTDSR